MNVWSRKMDWLTTHLSFGARCARLKKKLFLPKWDQNGGVMFTNATNNRNWCTPWLLKTKLKTQNQSHTQPAVWQWTEAFPRTRLLQSLAARGKVDATAPWPRRSTFTALRGGAGNQRFIKAATRFFLNDIHLGGIVQCCACFLEGSKRFALSVDPKQSFIVELCLAMITRRLCGRQRLSNVYLRFLLGQRHRQPFVKRVQLCQFEFFSCIVSWFVFHLAHNLPTGLSVSSAHIAEIGSSDTGNSQKDLKDLHSKDTYSFVGDASWTAVLPWLLARTGELQTKTSQKEPPCFISTFGTLNVVNCAQESEFSQRGEIQLLLLLPQFEKSILINLTDK